MAVALNISEDDEVDGAFATTVLDDLATSLERLTAEDRRDLVAIARRMAAQEPDEERREALEDIPDDLDLLDD